MKDLAVDYIINIIVFEKSTRRREGLQLLQYNFLGRTLKKLKG